MIGKHSRHFAAWLSLIMFTTASAASDNTLFARVTHGDDDQPQSLQVALVSYGPEDGSSRFRVDLVSAIHIGDEAYYADLNERFVDYDAVLYELVAPPGTVVTADDPGQRGLLSMTQSGLTNLLGLTFQLEQIDYGAANFVHADLSRAELSQRMDERGESMYVYFWRLFYASVREYAKDPLGVGDWKMLATMLGSGQDPALKTLFAYEITNLESMQDILGEDSDSALIGARNERAIEVLRKTLDNGSTRVGIFYGVAHMPDLEDRLRAMGLVRTGTVWIDAWQLAGGPTGPTELE
jgi:hypothetical protein